MLRDEFEFVKGYCRKIRSYWYTNNKNLSKQELTAQDLVSTNTFAQASTYFYSSKF